MIKTDAYGNKLWDEVYSGGSYASFSYVQQTTDGGYIITGTCCTWDVWLIKTEADGYMLWSKSFGASGDSDNGYSVQQTIEGGYIISGSTCSYGNGYPGDVWLIKTDVDGNMIWDKTFGGTGPGSDVGKSVQQTMYNGYIVTGANWSSGSGDVWLIYYDHDYVCQINIIEDSLELSYPGGGSCPPTSAQLHETHYGCDGSILWESSNPTIADVNMITGVVTAYGVGNVTITAFCSDESTCLDTCPVTVIACSNGCQINIIENSLDLSYPGGEGCDPTEYDLNFNYEYCTGTILWESSDEAVATVDSNGHVTAVNLGSCIIKAECSTDEACYDECPVTVVPCSSSEHGEGGTEDDEGYCVTQTSDGGYIVTGYTASYGDGSKDIWLIKYNEWFTKEWDKTFGGAYDDAGWFVIQSGDGGYVLCGDDTVDPLGEIIQCVGLKLDYNGNMWRTLTYGGSSGWNGGRCVRPIYNTKGDKSSEIGYIFVGYNRPNSSSDYDVLLIKTDKELFPQWQPQVAKIIGGSNDDFGNSVVVANDGSFVIAGWTGTYQSTNCDILVIKTDSDGNVISGWPKNYNIQDGDEGNYIMQTSDNGYIIAGSCGLYGSNDSDLFLMKIDSAGTKQWHQTYGDANNNDEGFAVVQTSDGGFFISGYYVPQTTKGKASNKNLYLVKTDEDGNKLWAWEKGGSLDDTSHHLNMSACQEGGIILTGYTESYSVGGKDLWLVSFNSTPAVPFSTKNILIISAIILSGLLLFLIFISRRKTTKL